MFWGTCAPTAPSDRRCRGGSYTAGVTLATAGAAAGPAYTGTPPPGSVTGCRGLAPRCRDTRRHRPPPATGLRLGRAASAPAAGSVRRPPRSADRPVTPGRQGRAAARSREASEPRRPGQGCGAEPARGADGPLSARPAGGAAALREPRSASPLPPPALRSLENVLRGPDLHGGGGRGAGPGTAAAGGLSSLPRGRAGQRRRQRLRREERRLAGRRSPIATRRRGDVTGHSPRESHAECPPLEQRGRHAPARPRSLRLRALAPLPLPVRGGARPRPAAVAGCGGTRRARVSVRQRRPRSSCPSPRARAWRRGGGPARLGSSPPATALRRGWSRQRAGGGGGGARSVNAAAEVYPAGAGANARSALTGPFGRPSLAASGKVGRRHGWPRYHVIGGVRGKGRGEPPLAAVPGTRRAVVQAAPGAGFITALQNSRSAPTRVRPHLPERPQSQNGGASSGRPQRL